MRRTAFLLLLGFGVISLISGEFRPVVKTGQNLIPDVENGFMDSDGKKSLRIHFKYKDPFDRTPCKIWFTAETSAPIDRVQDAQGLRCSIRRNIEGGWHLKFFVRENDGCVFYSPLFRPLSREYRAFQAFFKDFKCASSHSNRTVDIKKITHWGINGGSQRDVLYIRDFQPLKKDLFKQKPFLRVNLANGKNGLLEPGRVPLLNFVSAKIPKNIAALHVEIKDYYGKIIFTRRIPAAIKFGLSPEIRRAGYYEVRVFPEYSDGTKSSSSVLLTGGSLQIPGLSTFAVLPQTFQSSREAIHRYGETFFYGIQDPRYREMDKQLGVPWMIEMPIWFYAEKEKPVRKNGIAEWARKKMNEPKAPETVFAFCSFAPYVPPKWHQGKYDFKKFANGADSPEFLSFLEDAVRVNRYRYSHMKKRPYELTWEVNLKFPPNGTIDFSDVVLFHKRTVPVVKRLDPNAVICGPKATWDLPWVEKIFKAGLGNYLDAISMHMYSTPVPEDGKLPEKIAELRSIAKRYTGKDMPVYNTEAGYQSRTNGIDSIREQARKDIRYTLIMQGEKVDAFLLFYLLDFSKDEYNSWGLFFSDSPHGGFNPANLTPKPVVSAYANAVKLLAGAKPLANLRRPKSNLWGYVFEKDGRPVIALWNPRQKEKIFFPAGRPEGNLILTDIMGNEKMLNHSNGIAEFYVSEDPVYLTGADRRVWLGNYAVDSSSSLIAQKWNPGDVAPFSRKERLETFGSVSVEKTGNKTFLRIPADATPGILPVLCGNKVEFLEIQEPLSLISHKFFFRNSVLGVRLEVENKSRTALASDFKLVSWMSGLCRKKVKVPPVSRTFLEFELGKFDKGFNPLKPLTMELTVASGNWEKRNTITACFIASSGKNAGPLEKPFTNRIFLEDPNGENGKTEVQFFHDSKNLILKLFRSDKIHNQPYTAMNLWRGDSVQVAFDTDPESSTPYDEMTARFSKKITALEFALQNDGKICAARHETFQEKILPTGDVSPAFPDTVITRTGTQTVYTIVIPWRQIGIASPNDLKDGKLGFSLLVNDLGTKNSKRKTHGLHGGIFDNSGYRNFGILNIVNPL